MRPHVGEPQMPLQDTKMLLSIGSPFENPHKQTAWKRQHKASGILNTLVLAIKRRDEDLA